MNKYNFTNKINWTRYIELEKQYDIVKIKTKNKLKIAYCYKNGQLLCESILNIVKITPIKTQKAILNISYNGIKAIKI